MGNDINIGDVVQLRSGGPHMTVESFLKMDPANVMVAWHKEDLSISRAVLSKAAVKLIDNVPGAKKIAPKPYLDPDGYDPKKDAAEIAPRIDTYLGTEHISPAVTLPQATSPLLIHAKNIDFYLYSVKKPGKSRKVLFINQMLLQIRATGIPQPILVGDICRFKRKDLLGMTHVGEDTVSAVEDALTQLELRLGGVPPDDLKMVAAYKEQLQASRVRATG